MKRLIPLGLAALLASCAPTMPSAVRLAEQVKFVSAPVDTVEGEKDGLDLESPVLVYSLPLRDEYGRLWGLVSYTDRGEKFGALSGGPCPPDPVLEKRYEERRKQYDAYKERVKKGLPEFPFSHHVRRCGGMYTTVTLDVAAFREFLLTKHTCTADYYVLVRDRPDGHVSLEDQVKVSKFNRQGSKVDTLYVVDPYFADDPIEKIADDNERAAAEKRRDEWFHTARDLMEKEYGMPR